MATLVFLAQPSYAEAVTVAPGGGGASAELSQLVGQACPSGSADPRCPDLLQDLRAIDAGTDQPLRSFNPLEHPLRILFGEAELALISERVLQGPVTAPIDGSLTSFASIRELRDLGLPFDEEKYARLFDELRKSSSPEVQLRVAAKSIIAAPRNGWGLLGVLAGNWFSHYNHAGPFCPRESSDLAPRECWVHVFWETPGATLKREWFTQAGQLAATDTIKKDPGTGLLSGTRNFASGTTEAIQVSTDADYKFTENGITYLYMGHSLVSHSSGKQFTGFSYMVKAVNPGDRMTYSSSLPEFVKSSVAARRAEGQMLANRQAQRESEREHDAFMSSLLSGLQDANVAVQAEVQRSGAELEASIRQGQQTADSSLGGNGNGDQAQGDGAHGEGSTGTPQANSETAGAATATTASAQAAPRRVYSWCWASTSARITHMSGVGSRDVSVDEQEQWRSDMQREFKQQISVDSPIIQCDIDTDGDFSYTRGGAAPDKPVQVPWAPH